MEEKILNEGVRKNGHTLVHDVPCTGCGDLIERSVAVDRGKCWRCKHPLSELSAVRIQAVREREERIVEKLIEGLSLAKIGAEEDPPVSASRIGDIVRRIERREDVKLPRCNTGERVTTRCANPTCGKHVQVGKRAYKGEGHHYCGKECVVRYRNPDGSHMNRREVERYRYHNDPKRRASHERSGKKYRAHMPDHVKKKLEEYQRQWREKNKDRINERLRARYAARKAAKMVQ